LVKCEIISLCICGSGFLPDTAAKIEIIIEFTKFSKKKITIASVFFKKWRKSEGQAYGEVEGAVTAETGMDQGIMLFVLNLVGGISDLY